MDKNYKALPQLISYLSPLNSDLKKDLLVKLFADENLTQDEIELAKNLSENSKLVNLLYSYMKDGDKTISTFPLVKGLLNEYLKDNRIDEKESLHLSDLDLDHLKNFEDKYPLNPCNDRELNKNGS